MENMYVLSRKDPFFGDGGYGIYGNHGSCYARILQIETIVED